MRTGNFRPSPERDRFVFFRRDQVIKDLVSILSMVKELEYEYPKLFVRGEWREGKTHLLYHIQTLLPDIYHWIYIELPDYSGEEPFVDGFYVRLVKATRTRELISEGVSQYIRACPRNWDSLKDQSPEACERLDYFAFHPSDPTAVDRLTKDVDHILACEILHVACHAVHKVTNKPIAFLLDEAHRIGKFAPDHKTASGRRVFGEWTTAFKKLFAPEFPAVFVFASGVPIDDMAITRDPEIGLRALRRLELGPIEDLAGFVQDIIRYACDGWSLEKRDFNPPSEDIISMIGELDKEYEECITVEFYPLSKEAFEEYVKKLSEYGAGYPAFKRPATICELLNDIARDPDCRKRRVILREDVNRLFKAASYLRLGREWEIMVKSGKT